MKKKKKKLPDFGLLPEPAGTPLRLCQNWQTGMLYLNRLATKEELAALTARLTRETDYPEVKSTQWHGEDAGFYGEE